jgi:hypothetical protein
MSKTTRNILIAAPVILLLLAIAIPNFLSPRVTLSENACANNLRWIQEAKAKWARDMKKAKTAVPTEDDLTPALKVLGAGNFFPRCPAGGTYTVGPVGDPVKCSVGGLAIHCRLTTEDEPRKIKRTTGSKHAAGSQPVIGPARLL